MIEILELIFRLIVMTLFIMSGYAITKLQKKVKELEEKDIYEPTTVTQNTDIWRTKDDKIGIEIN